MIICEQVLARLRASDAAWGKGDIQDFMAIFAPEVMTVSTAGISRGRDSMEIRITQVYGNELRGTLVTTVESMQMLTDDIVAVIGRFELRDTSTSDISGCFSQVWMRDICGPRVVLDHVTYSNG